MEKKKIFVLDSVFGRDIFQEIMDVAEDMKIPVDIEGYEIKRKIPIPLGKDIYFLHLTDIDLKDVEKLRKVQPRSYFVATTRAGISYEDSKLFNESLTIFDYDDFEGILKRALENNK